MKRLLILAALVILAVSSSAQAKIKLAVLDAVVSEDIDSSAIVPVTETVIEQFVASGRYTVLDRANVDRILEELELQNSGLIDEGSAVKAGQMLGADSVAIIKVQKLEGVFFMSVKVIDVKTAEIQAQASTSRETPKLADLIEMAQATGQKASGATAVAQAGSSASSSSGASSGAAGASAGSTAQVGQFKLGIVINGKVENDPLIRLALKGIMGFAKLNGFKEGEQIFLVQVPKPEEYEKAVVKFTEAKPTIIIGIGPAAVEPIKRAAARFPDSLFAIVDAHIDAPNVVSLTFQEGDGAFLGGVATGLAAKKAGKKTVGFIGGRDLPVIRTYLKGFEAGVKAVFPECKVLVEWAGDFDAPDKGKALAKKLFDKDAFVIFPVAGRTGIGAFEEAKERAKRGDRRWMVGVDIDQYELGVYQAGKSVTLTSVVKRYDLAAHFLARSALDGRPLGGMGIVMGILEGGIGVPEENPNLAVDMIREVKQWEARIRNGEFSVPR
jgi:basic membrane protein A